MKKIYNVCISSPDEVLFRDEADHTHFINCYARALEVTDASSYCDVEMSTHGHFCLAAGKLPETIRSIRTAYSMYFNNRWHRRGKLGESGYYAIEVLGLNHFLTVICYDMRNPVHHGLTPTPFSYPYSSVNCYFREDLGKTLIVDRSLSLEEIRQTLPRRARWSDDFVMNESGIFIRDSFTEVKVVERQFGSARSFNYLMNRVSGEEWRKMQEQDQNGIQPFSLETVEAQILRHQPNTEQILRDMYDKEHGRFRKPAMDDLQLCSLIDNEYVPDLGMYSVYDLAPFMKERIAKDILRKHQIPFDQIKRCLVL